MPKINNDIFLKNQSIQRKIWLTLVYSCFTLVIGSAFYLMLVDKPNLNGLIVIAVLILIIGFVALVIQHKMDDRWKDAYVGGKPNE